MEGQGQGGERRTGLAFSASTASFSFFDSAPERVRQSFFICPSATGMLVREERMAKEGEGGAKRSVSEEEHLLVPDRVPSTPGLDLLLRP